MKMSTKNWWTALCLGIIGALAIQASSVLSEPTPATAKMVHVEQQEQTGEVTGKVKAVNAEDQTFQLEGSDPLIEVNTTTTFGAGLKFSDLKEGDEVRIVGVLRPDGKFEAREIHRQGGAPQSQE